MTQEADPNTAMRRTNSGGAIVRDLTLLDGILRARGIKYTFPELLEDNLFLQHTMDGQLVWAPAQGAQGIQGPPGEAGPHTTILPFASITGLIEDDQVPLSVVEQHESSLVIQETQIPDGVLLARVADVETISGNWTINGSWIWGATLNMSTNDITNVGTITATTVAGALSTVTQNAVTTMTGLTTIGTLVGGAVAAFLVTAGTFGAGNYVFPADVTVAAPSQDYLFTGDGAALAIQSQSGATTAGFHLFTKDGDGTDSFNFRLYAKGTPGSTADFERLNFKYKKTGPIFELMTTAGGTGTVRALHIYTGANSTQIVLNTDGTVSFSGSMAIGGAIVAGKELVVHAASGFAEIQLRGAAGSSGTVEFSDNGTATADIFSTSSKDLTFRTNGTSTALTLASGGAADFQGNTVSMGALTATTINGTIIDASTRLEISGAGFLRLNGVDVMNKSATVVQFFSGSNGFTFPDNVLIGTTTAATGSPRLDVVAAVGSPTIVLSNRITDAAVKFGVVNVRHYTNAEETVLLLQGFAQSAANLVALGGGDSGFNAATVIEFYTAANTTTLTGTLAADITGVGASSLLHLRGKLQVVGTTTFNTVAYTWPGADGAASEVLSTNGAGVLSWTAAGAGDAIKANNETISGTWTFTSQLSLVASTSGAIQARFQNSTTGSTGTDGLLVGISAAEAALIWNYENTALILATNNNGRLTIANDGGVTIAQNLTVSGAISVAGGTNNFYRAVNSGNPEINLGASATNDLAIQTVYDAGTQVLNYVTFWTTSSSAVADKGRFQFLVDGSVIFDIKDAGIIVTGTGTFSGDLILSKAATGLNLEVKHGGTQNVSLSSTSAGGVVNVRDSSGTAVITLDGRGTNKSIFNAGNLLLGTTTDPGEKLHIATSDEYQFSWQRTALSNRWGFGSDSLRTYIADRTTNTIMQAWHEAGNITIGTVTAATGSPRLDVVAAAAGVALVGADSTTNAAAKTFRIGGRHFTNAEEPIAGLSIDAVSATVSNLNIGGGTGAFNAPTAIRFFTAANTTTTTGTLRMTIDSAGKATFTGDVQINLSNDLLLDDGFGAGGHLFLTDNGDVNWRDTGTSVARILGQGDSLFFFTANVATERVRIVTGMLVGEPTGSDKGVGTINCAGDIYKNNSAYTNPDYVFELAYHGFAPHAPWGFKLRTLAETEVYAQRWQHLPGVHPERAMGMFDRGDWVLEKLEEAYLHLFAHDHLLYDFGGRFQDHETRIETLERENLDLRALVDTLSKN